MLSNASSTNTSLNVDMMHLSDRQIWPTYAFLLFLFCLFLNSLSYDVPVVCLLSASLPLRSDIVVTHKIFHVINNNIINKIFTLWQHYQI